MSLTPEHDIRFTPGGISTAYMRNENSSFVHGTTSPTHIADFMYLHTTDSDANFYTHMFQNKMLILLFLCM